MSSQTPNPIEKVASTHLGQQNQYVDQYDVSLLVKIPRVWNREAYAIDEANLPFIGTDVWHAYEVSVLTEKGLPVNGMLKIIVPAHSECIIESKSLKLYLNSFNMTHLGTTQKDCIRLLESKVQRDLSDLLNENIECRFYQSMPKEEYLGERYTDLSEFVDLDVINFDQSELKVARKGDKHHVLSFKTDLLRSNCRVTNQPDWGDVLIQMKTKNIPDYASIVQYIVSHRKLNHFHEEVCEMMFMHFLEVYQPESLSVMCLYTRRGGIDINPIRATSDMVLPKSFTSLNCMHQPTLRQ